MVIWPSGLPQASLNDSYAVAVGSTLIRTQMDIGPAKVRRRQSRPINIKTVGFVFTDEQLAIFEGFVKNSIFHGANAFEFPLPCGAGYEIVRIVPQSDETLYTIERNSNKWNIGLTLEVMP